MRLDRHAMTKRREHAKPRTGEDPDKSTGNRRYKNLRGHPNVRKMQDVGLTMADPSSHRHVHVRHHDHEWLIHNEEQSDSYFDPMLRRIEIEEARNDLTQAINEARWSCSEISEICGGSSRTIEHQIPNFDLLNANNKGPVDMLSSAYDFERYDGEDIDTKEVPMIKFVETVTDRLPSSSCLVQHKDDFSISPTCKISLYKVRDAAENLNAIKMKYMKHDHCGAFWIPILIFFAIVMLIKRIAHRNKVCQRHNKIFSAIHRNPDLRAVVEAESGELVPPGNKPASCTMGKILCKSLGVFIFSFLFISMVIVTMDVIMNLKKSLDDYDSHDASGSAAVLMYSYDLSTVLLWWSIFIFAGVMIKVIVSRRSRQVERENDHVHAPSAPPASSLPFSSRIFNVFHHHGNDGRYAPMTGTRNDHNIDSDDLTTPLYQPPSEQNPRSNE